MSFFLKGGTSGFPSFPPPAHERERRGGFEEKPTDFPLLSLLRKRTRKARLEV